MARERASENADLTQAEFNSNPVVSDSDTPRSPQQEAAFPQINITVTPPDQFGLSEAFPQCLDYNPESKEALCNIGNASPPQMDNAEHIDIEEQCREASSGSDTEDPLKSQLVTTLL